MERADPYQSRYEGVTRVRDRERRPLAPRDQDLTQQVGVVGDDRVDPGVEEPVHRGWSLTVQTATRMSRAWARRTIALGSRSAPDPAAAARARTCPDATDAGGRA